jgi:hypothetical protein
VRQRNRSQRHELVINESVRSCCGRPTRQCSCGRRKAERPVTNADIRDLQTFFGAQPTANAARGRGVANPVELRHQREVMILNQHAQQFGTESTDLVFNAAPATPAEDWTPSLEEVLRRDVRRRLVRNGNQSSNVVRRNAATGQMLDSSFQANPETPIGTPPFEDEKLSQNDDDNADGDMSENDDDDMADNDGIGIFRPVGMSSRDDSGIATGAPSAQGVIGDAGWPGRPLYAGGDTVGQSQTRNSVAEMTAELDYAGLASPAIRTGSWRR